MTLVKPLDELLQHELLVSPFSDEIFDRNIGILRNEYASEYLRGSTTISVEKHVAALFSNQGLKFLLFTDQAQEYLRILRESRDINSHRHILQAFKTERTSVGVEPYDFRVRGGGDIRAARKNGLVTLSFEGRSGAYLKYNLPILEKTLQANLNPQIKYRCI